MPVAFISHSSEDAGFVERHLVPALKTSGVDVWFSRTSIRTAEEWQRSILSGLESSDWFVVVVSVNAAKSRWVRAETGWAFSNREGRILPVLIGQCDPYSVHMLLADLQFADGRRDPGKGAADAAALLEAQRPAPPPVRESAAGEPRADVFPLAGLAHAQMMRGDFIAAIRELDGALELAPGDSRLLFLRGVSCLGNSQTQDAIRDLTQALQGAMNPLARSQGCLYRARAYASYNDDKRAIADCAEAIKADPNNGDAYLLRGRLRRRNLELDAAIDDVTEALKLSPEKPEAFLERAEAYRQKNLLQNARADYAHALKLDPGLLDKVPPHLRNSGTSQSGDPARIEEALRSLRAIASLAQIDRMQPSAKSKALSELMSIGFPKVFADIDYLISVLPSDRPEHKAAVAARDVAIQSKIRPK
jgi:tetratricopeptide (TPR) repeat protein